MSIRGKIWFTWCIVLAAFAWGGAYDYLRWLGAPHAGAAVIAAFTVLPSALYFLMRGAEVHVKEAERNRREGYKDPGDPLGY